MADCPKGMARQIRNATFTLVDHGTLIMITGVPHLGGGRTNPPTKSASPPASSSSGPPAFPRPRRAHPLAASADQRGAAVIIRVGAQPSRLHGQATRNHPQAHGGPPASPARAGSRRSRVPQRRQLRHAKGRGRHQVLGLVGALTAASRADSLTTSATTCFDSASSRSQSASRLRSSRSVRPAPMASRTSRFRRKSPARHYTRFWCASFARARVFPSRFWRAPAHGTALLIR
jgi:hypothetical protein